MVPPPSWNQGNATVVGSSIPPVVKLVCVCKLPKSWQRVLRVLGVGGRGGSTFWPWVGVTTYRLAIGTYRLAIGTCRLAVGTCRLAVGTYRLAVGRYRLAVGTYRLAVGTYRLAVGTYRLAKGT